MPHPRCEVQKWQEETITCLDFMLVERKEEISKNSDHNMTLTQDYNFNMCP